MISKWLSAEPTEVGLVLVSAVVTYCAILIYTRIAGLRSFSKMSASDFAMTVAVGSLFASTISSDNPSLLLGLVALACLYIGQWALAWARQASPAFSKLVDNEPLLLMHGPTIIEENLTRANVSRSDLYGKLRDANALVRDQIIAVVFETTGDISVLHSQDPQTRVDADFVSDVIGAENIERQR